jgi:hypothetical protein
MNGGGVIYAMNGVGGDGNSGNKEDQQSRPTAAVQNQRKPAAAEDGGEPKEVRVWCDGWFVNNTHNA